MKGYVTAMGYMGLVEEKYILFCSESDYVDYREENVRPAAKEEIREFHRMQAIPAEKIRMGLYTAEAAAG